MGYDLKHEKSTVCTGSILDFCKFMSFTGAKKTGLIDFPKNELRLKLNIYYQSAKFYGISPKETRENSLSVLFVVLMLAS